jgi:hypothetical protein
MNIPTTSAQLAAQNFAAGTAQPQRQQSAPRRIDLVELTSKPEQVARPPVREAQAPVASGVPVPHEARPAWTDARPLRPGSKLDIRV